VSNHQQAAVATAPTGIWIFNHLALILHTISTNNNGRITMGIKALSKILVTSGLALMLGACASSSDKDARVTISSGDSIVPINDLQYRLPFVVQVADLDGAPSDNVSVSIKVKITRYFKGSYAHTDLDGDGTTDKWVKSDSASCNAEDTNNNGRLDAGEDLNNNGLLDPKTPTITESSTTPTLIPGTSELITDDNGFGYFSLTYPKTEASWVEVEITATAEDGKPENSDVETLRLYVALDDLDPVDDPPAFVVSPYGTSSSCNDTF